MCVIDKIISNRRLTKDVFWVGCKGDLKPYLREAAERVYGKLSSRDQGVIQARYIENLSFVEIANMINLSKQSVGVIVRSFSMDIRKLIVCLQGIEDNAIYDADLNIMEISETTRKALYYSGLYNVRAVAEKFSDNSKHAVMSSIVGLGEKGYQSVFVWLRSNSLL